MGNLTFDAINRAWNNVRRNQSNLAGQGINLSSIILQRIDENDQFITVMFRGFDQALDDTERDAPIVKRYLLQWLKKYAEVQIARGDSDSFILRVTKPVEIPPERINPAAPKMTESLVHISSVRKRNGN
jgi:hypothetical protein